MQAVVTELDEEPVVIDAAAILQRPFTVAGGTISVDHRDVTPGRGWLRRLAPDGWVDGVRKAGSEAAGRAAAISALATIARDDRFDWLTTLDRLGGSENKPHQYRLASAAGVPVPRWIVTTDPDALPQDGSWVAKPLGPGSFIDDSGTARVVSTRMVNLTDRHTIASVPFIVQQFVQASVHARVVTVRNHVWSGTLPAAGLPLDWRTSQPAHRGFTGEPAPRRVHEMALTVASANSVGYSAQDWIRDQDGTWWFVDLNPAGQWLFLPETVAAPVSAAVAAHLNGHG